MSQRWTYRVRVSIDGHAVIASGVDMAHDGDGANVSVTLHGKTTLERQMALETLAGNEASACALADRLIEKRRAGLDVMGEMMTALRMVLLFHRGGIWGEEEMRAWEEATGQKTATTRGLCDVVRAALTKAEGKT